MRRLVKRFRTMLRRSALAFAVFVALAMVPPATSSGENSGSVTLTRAEADSLATLIEGQAERIRLLEIDLWECRELAAADSSFAAERERLMQEYYDGLVKDLGRENWFRKTLGHPVIWFAAGAYLGVRATEAN